MDGSVETASHIDVCDPFRIATAESKTLFVTFTVISHHYVRVALIKSRDEIRDYCCKSIAWLNRNNSNGVKRLHSDNSKEFLEMATMLEKWEFSILFQCRIAQNLIKLRNEGVGICWTKFALCLEKNVCHWIFLGETLNHAARLHSGLPPNTLHSPITHDLLLGISIDNSKLRIVGCAAFVHIDKQASDSELDDHC